MYPACRLFLSLHQPFRSPFLALQSRLPPLVILTDFPPINLEMSLANALSATYDLTSRRRYLFIVETTVLVAYTATPQLTAYAINVAMCRSRTHVHKPCGCVTDHVYICRHFPVRPPREAPGGCSRYTTYTAPHFTPEALGRCPHSYTAFPDFLDPYPCPVHLRALNNSGSRWEAGSQRLIKPASQGLGGHPAERTLSIWDADSDNDKSLSRSSSTSSSNNNNNNNNKRKKRQSSRHASTSSRGLEMDDNLYFSFGSFEEKQESLLQIPRTHRSLSEGYESFPLFNQYRQDSEDDCGQQHLLIQGKGELDSPSAYIARAQFILRRELSSVDGDSDTDFSPSSLGSQPSSISSHDGDAQHHNSRPSSPTYKAKSWLWRLVGGFGGASELPEQELRAHSHSRTSTF
ncbi:hypothetical protein ASPZODRAFT_197365 [Penicilliopsis zonata CBS 506.65]|uniref:Uncharacterized protein n=1 Tax=Penicilliopsis zonata CBS 506.65 TaxID=1073090 RepID=A0A1L9STJ2_9EURO|nr:hypothetical protein ASPZODRAFT_197365 [Penicilliopsis zonata CBS 506.65]OJJ50518.1 hypothetical protein ASPZODRAFT_197365 [Penicilliopsis zonata CBS 506.65]